VHLVGRCHLKAYLPLGDDSTSVDNSAKRPRAEIGIPVKDMPIDDVPMEGASSEVLPDGTLIEESPSILEGLNLMFEVNSSQWTHSQVAQMFTEAFLYRGSKTITHMSRLMALYGSLFDSFRPSCLNDSRMGSDDAEYFKVVINTIYSFW